ncbi:response regulator [Rugamonas sp. CCM 8940]|uniref:hybrid sensor histidine kinase/response regulator n=1 Tax=Rugamonas sp. CCM 8940 TaxID=2765359 RepID=UPI0018F57C4C|nr:hybrid sensor histidine kinase/response regulator [Rugamonas sp. CCM 8940]MBJ7314053.1 hybrid sensor histidine kinase/response regulator [Rugamonas sp. CCM 8940]
MERRILIHAPLGRDAALAAEVLARAGLPAQVCAGLDELARQLDQGAGCVLLVEEALAPGGFRLLRGHVARQPNWSDLPILLLTHRGADSPAVRQAVAELGNLTLLERPVRVLTLITALQALLRARGKQYQVREAERRKDEFLASLGHELRNPLTPIRTSGALLAHLYPDSAPLARVRQVIERQVTHLTRLVDDLLDVARITTGKIALRRERVAFGAVMDHVLELCQPAAAAKQIALTTELPAQPIELDVDHARVVQIFANILSNAVKFTPPGGRVALRAGCDGAMLRVSIRDNGIGLEPEAIERIFTMFEQSRTVGGQISSGLGIGLSLSRRFAEMHGGDVEARSAGHGQGSEFLIQLPVVVVAAPARRRAADVAAAAAAPAAAAPAVGSESESESARASVLVVDDNDDAADSLAALLELEGFSVAVAYDGASSVTAAAARRPDVIVMDLGMPGMDGYQAARQIRAAPGGGAILLIALTGWGQSDARRRTVEAGFDHHLIKPVDIEQILRLAGDRLRHATAAAR